jgi:hypothetical protein
LSRIKWPYRILSERIPRREEPFRAFVQELFQSFEEPHCLPRPWNRISTKWQQYLPRPFHHAVTQMWYSWCENIPSHLELIAKLFSIFSKVSRSTAVNQHHLSIFDASLPTLQKNQLQ